MVRVIIEAAESRVLICPASQGAGAGGTSTAARLAHAGFQVTVLEKNDFTGGRCSLLYHQHNHSHLHSLTHPVDERPYRFDQGPSLLLLPRFFHQTFEELGTSLEAEGVELRKCEPNYLIHFDDGHKVELSSDLATMKREVERWEGQEGFERYMSFLAESHRHYELSVQHVLLQNFSSLASMLRPAFLRKVFILHPFESIWTRASKYFWTERMRRTFTFGSMYMGMSPFDAPGTYSLLQYTELAEGIWYPVGGFHRVIQALVDVGKRLGVDYRMSTAVKKIILDEQGKKVKGVKLESGEMLEADVVVNNSDLVYAYNELLSPQSHVPSDPDVLAPTQYANGLSNRPASCSSISFYWALSRTVPELTTHNIFLDEDYKESFDSIFKKHLIPSGPSFYVNVPSRIDSTAAPDGRDSVVVLVPVGHLVQEERGFANEEVSEDGRIGHSTGHGHINNQSLPASPSRKHSNITPTTFQQDWPAMTALARQTILSTIAKRTGVDLGPLILHEQTNNPLRWKEKFNLDKGAILGLSHSFFNVLSFRPTTRARKSNAMLDGTFGNGVPGRIVELVGDLIRGRNAYIDGLYMVGASAYPGTGVPICLAGGRLVAEQICQDQHMSVPWRKGDNKVEPRNTRLDQIDRVASLVPWAKWLILAVLLSLAPWVVMTVVF